MIELQQIKRTDPRLLVNMQNHYSKPKGFVGRNICYAIMVNEAYFGGIVGGSTPQHLPGRKDFAEAHIREPHDLTNIVNNLFYHVQKPYPFRNFVQRVIKEYRRKIEIDWFLKYGDFVLAHETLVEIPREGDHARTGECYRRDGWINVATTQGYGCKRTGGESTDSWSGRRVWETEDLRPKWVFMRKAGK